MPMSSTTVSGLNSRPLLAANGKLVTVIILVTVTFFEIILNYYFPSYKTWILSDHK